MRLLRRRRPAQPVAAPADPPVDARDLCAVRYPTPCPNPWTRVYKFAGVCAEHDPRETS